MSTSARIHDLTTRPWSRELVADDSGRWIARVPELAGCFADGPTPAEALAQLDIVVGEWLAVRQQVGEPIPEPRKQSSDEYSGRFSVRVPRSLHRSLARRAETEGCSLNQLVTTLLAQTESSLVGDDQSQPTFDVHEQIAADAIGGGKTTIGALKGIATHLRNRGSTNLASLIYSFAALAVSETEGREAGGREAGIAAAFARRESRFILAEALLRQSLRFDGTNLRSASLLGQQLHHQGHFDEALGWLSRAKAVDRYAALFHGWSRLQLGLEVDDQSETRAGLEEVGHSLRQWAYQNSDRRGRASWLRQLHRLWLLGGDFAAEAEALREFANTQSNWATVEAEELGIERDTTDSHEDVWSTQTELRASG